MRIPVKAATNWEEEPPTQKQLWFLKHLNWKGEQPKTKGFARDIIAKLVGNSHKPLGSPRKR